MSHVPFTEPMDVIVENEAQNEKVVPYSKWIPAYAGMTLGGIFNNRHSRAGGRSGTRMYRLRNQWTQSITNEALALRVVRGS